MKVKKVLEFPSIRQGTKFSCGESAIQGMLYFYGIEVRESVIISEVGASPHKEVGISPKQVVNYLRKHGLKVEQRAPANVAWLKEQIEAGKPVVIAIQAWNEHPEKEDYSKNVDGHYVVVIGYGETSKGEPAIIIEDPALLGNRGYLTEEALVSRWHDQDKAGELYERLGIVVVDKEKKYNHKVFKWID